MGDATTQPPGSKISVLLYTCLQRDWDKQPDTGEGFEAFIPLRRVVPQIIRSVLRANIWQSDLEFYDNTTSTVMCRLQR